MAKQTTAYGKAVKKRLLDLGMSQRELAGMLGITGQYLNAVLNGRRSGKKYLDAIEKILETERIA